MVLVPNYRIGLFSHGESRSSRMSITNILFLSRIIELSNFFSHGESRRVSVLLSRDLSFGPTDQREVIIEFANWFIFTRRIAEFTDVYHEFANCRISFHTESHGESRDLCHELSNYRISFHTESHGGFLCHKTCSWSQICELSNFFLHTDGHGGYEGGTIEA